MSRIAVAALGLLVVACGAGTAGSSGLRGRTFLSESVTHDGKPRPGMQVRLEFHDDGRLSGSGGCNSVSGEVTLRGGRLRLPERGTTLMGCEPDLHADDAVLEALLGSDPTYTLDGDRLTLRSERTTIVLLDREVADPDRPLAGTTWHLDGYHEASDDGIAGSARGATLRFDGETVTFTIEGCAQGTGRAEITERTIRLPDPFVRTTSACREDQRRVEAHLTSVLKGTVNYEIEAGRLTIDRPDGAGLTFRAAD